MRRFLSTRAGGRYSFRRNLPYDTYLKPKTQKARRISNGGRGHRRTP